MLGSDVMSIILKRLIPMSMLVINLITTHYCFNKKEQTKKAIIILIGFTMFVLLISSLIKSIFNIQFIEGILMILLGATYFFPIKYIYQERNRNVLSVMIFSWIHTFTVTYFSLYLSDYFISKDTSTYAFIFQNLIFLITTPLVIRFIKKRFIYILNHIPKKIYHYLLTLSGLEFMILIITFTLLTKNSNPIWIISIGFGITAVSMIVYSLIYLIVKNQNEIYDLEEIVFIDHLTKLKNRAALFKDLNEYIENKLENPNLYTSKYLYLLKSILNRFN